MDFIQACAVVAVFDFTCCVVMEDSVEVRVMLNFVVISSYISCLNGKRQWWMQDTSTPWTWLLFR